MRSCQPVTGDETSTMVDTKTESPMSTMYTAETMTTTNDRDIDDVEHDLMEAVLKLGQALKAAGLEKSAMFTTGYGQVVKLAIEVVRHPKHFIPPPSVN